ncbi:MAG: outer membrane protein assembly factor BamD [Gemmatimonadetes bacterium]|nr:outer membrane protein assembly factor BamD [Gemmatimonadota bacterium]
MGALVACLASLLAFACMPGDPFPGYNADQLWESGSAAFEAENWDDAILAFERLTSQSPGYSRAPDARMLLARAHEARGEYLSAASEYENFLRIHYNNPMAPDASLGMCKAYAQLSPISQRDQSPTRTALDACARTVLEFQAFAVAQEAEKVRLQMVDKLAMAAFGHADFYRGRGCLPCAVNYFDEGVVLEYPTTDWAPRALLAMYHAYQELGWDEEEGETADRLIFNFPESEWAAQLQAEQAAAQDADSGQ